MFSCPFSYTCCSAVWVGLCSADEGSNEGRKGLWWMKVREGLSQELRLRSSTALAEACGTWCDVSVPTSAGMLRSVSPCSPSTHFASALSCLRCSWQCGGSGNWPSGKATPFFSRGGFQQDQLLDPVHHVLPCQLKAELWGWGTGACAAAAALPWTHLCCCVAASSAALNQIYLTSKTLGKFTTHLKNLISPYPHQPDLSEGGTVCCSHRC